MIHEYPNSNIHELNLDWIIKQIIKAMNIIDDLNKRFDEYLDKLPIDEMVKSTVDESFTGMDVEFKKVSADNIKGMLSTSTSPYVNIDTLKTDGTCGTWYLVMNQSVIDANEHLPLQSGQGLLFVKKQTPTGTYRQVYITVSGATKGIYTRYYNDVDGWSAWTKHVEFANPITSASNPDAINTVNGEWYYTTTPSLRLTKGAYLIMYASRFASNADGIRGIGLKNANEENVYIYSRVMVGASQHNNVTALNGSYLITLREDCDISLALYQNSGGYLDANYSTIRAVRLEDHDQDWLIENRNVNIDDIAISLDK